MNPLSQNVEKLLRHLGGFKPKRFNVVVMPDFFLDHFVSWKGNVRQFAKSVIGVAGRKGGSIDKVPQLESRGGNAVNTAAALAALNIRVFPIVITSKLGLNLLAHYLQRLNVDLSHVKVEGDASTTVALEFAHDGEKRNVMLRHLGSLEKFGPNNFTQEQYGLLRKADYACVFNWAGTRTHGTELAQEVFRCVKIEGRGKTYYDTADPLPNKPKIPELVENVLLSSDLVDTLSLNENEAITYAGQVSPKRVADARAQNRSMPMLAKECAEILAQELTSRIDLHTTTYSATFSKNKYTMVPAFKVKTLRATGAGDAWNAGNIFADANNFSVGLRLTFANAVAAHYVSGLTGEHPQLPQLLSFLRQILENRVKAKACDDSFKAL